MITTAKKDSPNRFEDFSQYRSLLFAIAYRMLGSVMDAEDMVQETQETFLRWQHSKQNVESTKAYLTSIVTRRGQKLGSEYKLELVRVNGKPDITYTRNDKIETVVAIDIVSDRIQSLYFMRNPDKLKHGFSQDVAEMAIHNLYYF